MALSFSSSLFFSLLSCCEKDTDHCGLKTKNKNKVLSRIDFLKIVKIKKYLIYIFEKNKGGFLSALSRRHTLIICMQTTSLLVTF